MVKNNLGARLKTKKKKITAKTDYFLNGGIEYIDYKDVSSLRKNFLIAKGELLITLIHN